MDFYLNKKENNMQTNFNYLTELAKLAAGLTLKGIRFEFNTVYDGGIIIVLDDNDNKLWDAVCHSGSNGQEDSLLEIMGDIVNKELSYDDTVEGYLTAEEILERL